MPVLSGSPLLDGSGWKLLVTGNAPPNIQVLRGNQPVPFQPVWRQLQPPPELGLRLGTVTIPIGNPDPTVRYRIRIPAQGFDRQWSCLPAALPPAGVSFLFASCFWRDDDKQGAYATGIEELQQRYAPAFKILSGDQVYLDWPAAPFQGDADTIHAHRYHEYWIDSSYSRVMHASPSLFTCDDHEYWNDYPEFQVHLSRTHTANSRQEYGVSADRLYEVMQHSLNEQVQTAKPWKHPLGINPAHKRWYSFSIGRVGFFVADTRSGRQSVSDGPSPQFFQDDQWDDIEAWQRGLSGPGVLVLGQPLFQEDGDFRDHSLSNFPNDYGRLCALIEDSQCGRNVEQKPHHILMLSGDIHTGRFSIGRIRNTGSQPAGSFLPDVYEFISSPASRIGPFNKEPSVHIAPAEIRARYKTGARVRQILWNVRNLDEQGIPTVENNVGMVKMTPTPGPTGRIRFELSLWRVRKSRPPTWKFWRDRDESSVPSFGRLFRTEINLQ